MTQPYTTVVGESEVEAALRAEIERLKREVDVVAGAMVRNHNRAEKAEAERDEARAQVAAAYAAAAKEIDEYGNRERNGLSRSPLDELLCCNGYQCGCQGATVGLYLQHRIWSLTPADAKASLEAYGREKVREGMQRAADLIDQNFDRNGWSAHKAILAAMETLK